MSLQEQLTKNPRVRLVDEEGTQLNVRCLSLEERHRLGLGTEVDKAGFIQKVRGYQVIAYISIPCAHLTPDVEGVIRLTQGGVVSSAFYRPRNYFESERATYHKLHKLLFQERAA